jgi:hypothetical protein
MNRHQPQRWTIVVLCLALLAGACSSGDDDGPEAGVRPSDSTGSFALRLSTGEAVGDPDAPLAVVAGEALSAETIAEITARLPALE